MYRYIIHTNVCTENKRARGWRQKIQINDDDDDDLDAFFTVHTHGLNNSNKELLIPSNSNIVRDMIV